MRHLPSIPESEVTGRIKAKTAKTPKPKRTMAMPRRYTVSWSLGSFVATS